MNWNNATILFKYTSRSRPDLFERGMHSILNNLSKPDKAVFVFTFDIDDPKLNEYRDVCFRNGWGGNEGNFYYGIELSKTTKIKAINRHLNTLAVRWDIIVNMSDDMVFTAKGFDDTIRQAFATHFPEGDGFVHFNDGYQRDNVSTMSTMDRKYYDRFKYIYHPSYKSVWCDVEATDVAYGLGRYVYMGDDNVIFNHLHPALGKAAYDDQYRASENLDVWGEDLKTIIERKSRNYDLPLTRTKYPDQSVANWKLELNAARVNNGLTPITF